MRIDEKCLTDLLKDVSKLDTEFADSREQIEYIDIEKIESDPDNFYALTNLDDLAANIELVGLQQPLRVRASEQNQDRVIVVSGHRRMMALSRLVAEGKTELRSVPCIRERATGSVALQELRLIYANRDTRVISSSELSKQAARVEMLLYQLKEEGFEFPGKMRDYVAQACKISAPKLARLKVIREKLVPAYMDLFEKDKLPEQTAYALARLPEEMQYRVLRSCPETPSGARLEDILRHYQEGWRWEPELTCPDGKACGGGDRFLRHDCESFYLCGGLTCCLDCQEASASAYSCQRMCSKAKQQRKVAGDKKKEEALERKRKYGRNYQKQTEAYAKRLVKVFDLTQIETDETIKWRSYRPAIPIADIRAWARGEFDDPANWTEAELDPQRCGSVELADIAKRFGCSIDYLMGLTEDIRPSQEQEDPLPVSIERCEVALLGQCEGQLAICGWMPGGTFPSSSCDIVADFEGDNGSVVRQACIYDGGNFYYYINGEKGPKIDLKIVRWMWLPPVEHREQNGD